MQIISRDQAVESNLKFYFTGNPCKHGHVVARNVIGRTCVTCKKENDNKSVANRKSKSAINFTQFFDGEVISKADALTLGLKYYFTRIECSRGHTAFRSVINSTCVHCAKDYHTDNYNGEKRERAIKRANEWSTKNPLKTKDIKTRWSMNNTVKSNESRVKHYVKRNEKRKLQRINGDSDFIIRETMSGMVKRISKLTGRKKKLKTCQYLQYNVTDLKSHLESLFEPGMTWSNHGEWHIDHIVPVSWWLKNGVTDPSMINALINLQPLWAEDNLAKSDKI